MPVFPSDAYVAHVNRICRYLALDDFAHRDLRRGEIQARLGKAQFDVVAVFGNQVLATVERACSLWKAGLASCLLFSGGVGHSTPALYANIRASRSFGPLADSGEVVPTMTEAEMMSALAISGCKVPASAILIENRSTNTGENARFSWELLRARMPGFRELVVIQDPVMQRRTLLTLRQTLRDVPQAPALFSHAVFVPETSTAGFLTPRSAPDPAPWNPARFVSLVLGEVERLRNDERGYGPRGRGFIPAEDVPADVLASYESVVISNDRSLQTSGVG